MDFFGALSSSPGTGINKQLDDIRLKMAKTKELTEKYNKKYDELVKFNRLLTDGYVNNLHVIVDISSLLNAYSVAMSDILMQLSKFDEILLKDIDNSSIQHIRELTSESLRGVNTFFEREVSKIKDIFMNFGRDDVVRKLNTVQGNFVTAQNESRQILQNGGRRIRLRKAVQIRRVPVSRGKQKK